MRSLFLTYDGLLSPLGQSQILPYLRGLRARGHEISILSFEKAGGPPEAQAQLTDTLAGEGILWLPLRYHKRPTVPATAFDIVQGVVAARWLRWRRGIEVMHARSYVPMLMALLAVGPRQIIFDMRGFWADERVDGNIWTRTRPIHKALYRLAKGLERWGLRRADHVVVLTHAAARLLGEIPGAPQPLPPTSIIPTCVDLEKFRPLEDRAAVRRALGLPDGRIIVYQGQVGTWYLLPEMAAFIQRARRRWPELLWLILAPAEHELIRAACTAAGLVEGSGFRLQALSHAEVPRWAAAADAALFFIRPSYSKLSSCPTKFGECLACGLPVVANGGVGDVAETLAAGRVGPAVSSFDDAAYDRAVVELASLWDDPQTPARCRRVAEAEFALGDAIARYDGIYRSLEGASSFRDRSSETAGG
jgi:glycosyltransferase involved in cell wall biosynthesis